MKYILYDLYWSGYYIYLILFLLFAFFILKWAFSSKKRRCINCKKKLKKSDINLFGTNNKRTTFCLCSNCASLIPNEKMDEAKTVWDYNDYKENVGQNNEKKAKWEVDSEELENETYVDRFDAMIQSLKKSIAVGLVASLIIVFIEAMPFWTFIPIGLILAFIFAIILSLPRIAAGAFGAVGAYLATGILNLVHGIISCVVSFSVFGLIVAFIQLLIAAAIAAVSAFYMTTAYVINLIYTGIMAHKEKNNTLGDKEACERADSRVEMIPVVLTVLVVILFVMTLDF